MPPRAAVRTLVLVALLAPGGGCEWLRKFGPDRDNAAQAQADPVEPVSAGKLVEYLNRQAGHLHSVRYENVSIDVYMGRQHNTLGDSTLVCARPRNFLLVGGKRALGELVHIGSNDREFWMLTRPPLDPTYVYCSHADFKQGAGQLPIPFDPDWALQALGMATYTYDPALPYDVETDQRLRLYTLTMPGTTPQGAPIKKQIVFDPQPGRHASHVRRHVILDADGKRIASAEVKEAVTVPANRVAANTREAQLYVQVPTRVVLEWPQQQAKMELRLGAPEVNERMTDAQSAELFSKPKPRDGVRPINLAEARFAPSSSRGATPGTERGRFGRR